MPTHYVGSREEVLALDTFIKLARCFTAVQSQILPHLQREFGLTESQFAVLEAIHHLGPLSPGQLCEKILRSGSNVTTVVDNLERDGLVTRERQDTDRRVQLVHLTKQGRMVIARALPAHVGRIAGALGALSKDEQLHLGNLCRTLGTAIANQ